MDPAVAAAGPLLLVGGGRMGEALLRGWLAKGLPAAAAHVVEPDPARCAALASALGVRASAGADGLPDGLAPRVLVLAVKPQVMDEVLPAYDALVGPGTLVLSIAAGRPIASFERAFAPGTAVVRAMPNTPAAVGRGVSVLCANPVAADPARRALAETLMAAVGEVLWVEDEDLLHAVTAVSGGGPAYVFLLIETLAAAAERAGLPSPLAERLARATVAGAGELARQSPEPADELRRNVTSPRGTTEAALRVLMAEGEGLGPLMERAIAAAASRSRELA